MTTEQQLPLGDIESLAYQATQSDQLQLAEIGQRVLDELSEYQDEIGMQKESSVLTQLAMAMQNEQLRVLMEKVEAGKSGWSIPSNAAYYNERMQHHAGEFRISQDKKHLVHLVNYAMFLWFVTPEKSA